MTDFEALDANLRLSWNVWPNSRLEATKSVIPFGALYTPNKVLPDMPVVQYEPVPCKSCGAFLNPYARVDFAGRIWICPFCHTRNHFPAHYQGISEQNLPAELFPNYCTIEYQLAHNKPVMPPAYVFVVDTCLPEDELATCRTALTQALQMIPEYAQVGLVTYGTHVHVHELGFAECAKSYVFQGSKEYTPQAVQDQLGLGASKAVRQPPSPAKPQLAQASPAARFVLPLSDCEFVISGVLDELQRDAFPTLADHRPARCTGTALQVASALMGACLPAGSCAARLLLFVGGPSTEGGGKVVDKELLEPIRSHKDLAKDSAPHFKKAVRFYDSLAVQLVGQGHSLDVFACSLDQVGLAEMKRAVEHTGGMVVQTDSFHNSVFKDSFKRVFAKPTEEGHLGIASNATFEVIPSKDVKVSGLLGPASTMEKKGVAVADAPMGMGGTTMWKLAGLDSRTTLSIFFEIVANAKDQQDASLAAQSSQEFFVQFITKYLHGEGTMRCRVTTFSRRWTDGTNLQDLIAGFDQEAAAVLIARIATYKMETEEDFDATRWLDRTLIRLASRFGDFRKEDPASFQLSPNMSYFPQFMFNLRRSQFVQVFGSSPDETAYCRLVLNRETVADAMVMIQPQLTSYGMGSTVEPVLLDVLSILPDRVLVLDSYFYVVVFHGTTIAQWRKAEYHLQPEHAAFAELLQLPMADAEALIQKRFPVPRLVDCDQNGSQARFLLAKLNPSATYNTSSSMSSEVIMTDDVSLQVFTDHLKKLAVQA
ncbi:hypothetical protein WJX72_000474 [[Myrmecia] bisecta]|uniref:Protein transport protein SEC23 n=1 Tax=[Myrmecia] bisecta TaxID=41462 RepID=A0AAW1Q0V1_9CHLO